MLGLSDRVRVPEHVLVRYLDGETVLLNLESEKYFGLDRTGTRMWELATDATSLEAAYGKLSEEFEVNPETLRTHFVELMEQLRENGLLQVIPADVTPSDVESIPTV
jgi:Coenzyme PQQ synthesis protein D (PqqD)